MGDGTLGEMGMGGGMNGMGVGLNTNYFKSFKHTGGVKSMRPISRQVRGHAVSLVMRIPVGPLLRMPDDQFDAVMFVWFDQPPNDALKDLGLISASCARFLEHLTALRERRINQMGDNWHGVNESLTNVMEIACSPRFSYQPAWSTPPPPMPKSTKGHTADAGRNVRPRVAAPAPVVAAPAPAPLFAIGDVESVCCVLWRGVPFNIQGTFQFKSLEIHKSLNP